MPAQGKIDLRLKSVPFGESRMASNVSLGARSNGKGTQGFYQSFEPPSESEPEPRRMYR